MTDNTPKPEDLTPNAPSEQEVQPQDAQNTQEVVQEDPRIKELEEQILRFAAEAENVKRRADIDQQKARDYAIEKFAKDMVNVLDNLYRASEVITDEKLAADPFLKNVKDGVELTKTEMLQALEKHNITRHSPLNEPFDHNFHQAMAQVPNNELPNNTVIEVIQAGYSLNNRLLRPALVNTSKKDHE